MRRQTLLFAACILLLGVISLATTAWADSIAVEGIVNEAAQIVTDDGETYELAKTELGDTVAGLAGARVLVTGTVEETEGKKIITVTKYLILDEEGRIT